MNTTGKVVLTTVLILATSIGVYAGVKSYAKNKNLKNDQGNTDGDGADAGSGAGSNSGSGTGVSLASNPFNTSTELKAFQKWANTQGASLAEDGKWGSKSAAAWLSYGSKYVPSGHLPPVTSWSNGDEIFIKKGWGVSFYSFPDANARPSYYLGKLNTFQAKDNPIATFIETTKPGWVKVKVKNGYTTPQNRLAGANTVAYVQAQTVAKTPF